VKKETCFEDIFVGNRHCLFQWCIGRELALPVPMWNLFGNRHCLFLCGIYLGTGNASSLPNQFVLGVPLCLGALVAIFIVPTVPMGAFKGTCKKDSARLLIYFDFVL